MMYLLRLLFFVGAEVSLLNKNISTREVLHVVHIKVQLLMQIVVVKYFVKYVLFLYQHIFEN